MANPRPSFIDIYASMSSLMAQRSTCRRLSVGAVITSEDFRYVYGVGFNGNAAGLPNDCDSDEPGKCGCVHAEVNAVVNCTVGRTVPKIVFCTDLPCVNCAKILINMGGVQQIYYGRDYRIRDSLEVFKKVGIPIEMLRPEVVRKQDGLKCLSSHLPNGCRATTDEQGEWNGYAFHHECPEHGTPLAPCGVCMLHDGVTKGGMMTIKDDCPEHGKNRPGQGMVERSNLESAREGMAAFVVQDQRRAIAAVDRANSEAIERDPQLKTWLQGHVHPELKDVGVYDHYRGGKYVALFVAEFRWFTSPPPSKEGGLLTCKHHGTREPMAVYHSSHAGLGGYHLTFLARGHGYLPIPEGTLFVIYVSMTYGYVLARPLALAGDDSWTDVVDWNGNTDQEPIMRPRFIRREEQQK